MLARLLLIFCLTFGAPQAAMAFTTKEQIIEELKDQGFQRIAVNRTWLGRVRFVATKRDIRREIILNPATGIILRDLWDTTDDDRERRLLSYDDDDADDDDDDDDDDDKDDDDDDDDDEKDDD